MKGIIAVDGGGTKTEFMLGLTTGEVLTSFTLAGTNLNNISLQAAIQILEQGLEKLSDVALKNKVEIAGIYFGLAGGVNGDNQKNVYNYFKNKYFQNIPFSNAGDDLNSINVGVKDAENGIAVIAGTGSNVMLKKDGIVLPNPQLSGWGYLFDNGASGFDFGRDAVIAAKKEYNGTGKRTLITKMLEARFNKNVFDCLKEFYDTNGTKVVASLAPIVFDAYRLGDKVAEEIIDKQVQNVADMINFGHRIIGQEKETTVGLCGGIFSHEYDTLAVKIKARIDKNMILSLPKESQIYGALMEAAKNAGVKADSSFLKNYTMTVNSPLLEQIGNEKI